MNAVRLRVKFVKGVQRSAIILAVIFALTALKLASNQADRNNLVSNLTSEVCTIQSKDIDSGKSPAFEWNLACPGPVRFRVVNVESQEYGKKARGETVVIYYSRATPGIWERQYPSQEWNHGIALRDWAIFSVILSGAVGIFIAIWKTARREEEFLRNASLVEAEILEAHSVDESRSSTVVLRIKFLLDGKWNEGKLSVDGKHLNDYFAQRKLQIAVNPTDVQSIKALSSMVFAELV